MGKFFAGLIIGAVVAFLAGINVGAGKPLLSNPFAGKPIMQDIKDTATRATEEAKRSAKEASDKASKATKETVDKARQAVHEATAPEKKK